MQVNKETGVQEDTAEDPLRELLVDAGAVDRRQIAEALRGRIAIDSDTGRLVLTAGFSALDARRKIVAVLLARKAAVLLEASEQEALSNKEVTGITGLASGTAAPGLKSLRELRLVGQDTSKSYLIPNAHLADAIQFLQREF